MCMIGDDDYWDWWDERVVKACRKPRPCGECDRMIERGEPYMKSGGLHDGRFRWHSTCLQCDAASLWLMNLCGGWVFNARYEDLREHAVGDEKYLTSKPLVQLTWWMRRKWRDENGALRPREEVHALAVRAEEASRANMALRLAS